MKKLLYLLPLGLFGLAGCQSLEEAAAEAPALPQEFWMTVREVILYVVDFLWQIASGWLTGLLG